MVTTVGTENTFEKLVQNLLILEHDAIAAYDSTIDKLEDQASKTRIAEFKACLLYTSPSPRDQRGSRMPSSA